MIVYLVRHTSVNVPKGITYGFSDVELNNTFEEEAAKTKAELENISFDEVFQPAHPMPQTCRLLRIQKSNYRQSPEGNEFRRLGNEIVGRNICRPALEKNGSETGQTPAHRTANHSETNISE